MSNLYIELSTWIIPISKTQWRRRAKKGNIYYGNLVAESSELQTREKKPTMFDMASDKVVKNFFSVLHACE